MTAIGEGRASNAITVVVPAEQATASPLYHWQAGRIGARADVPLRIALAASALSLTATFAASVADLPMLLVPATLVPPAAMMLCHLRLRRFILTAREQGLLRDLWLAGEPEITSLAGVLEGGIGRRVRLMAFALLPAMASAIYPKLLGAPAPLWLLAALALPGAVWLLSLRERNITLTVADAMACLAPVDDWRAWGHVLLPFTLVMPLLPFALGGALWLGPVAVAVTLAAIVAQQRLIKLGGAMPLEQRWCEFIGVDTPGPQHVPSPFPDMKPLPPLP